jgi:hypothetical protein
MTRNSRREILFDEIASRRRRVQVERCLIRFRAAPAIRFGSGRSQMSSQVARALIFDGPIATQNDRRESHEAIVLEKGKVLATDTLDNMRSLAGSSAVMIDA